MSVGHTGLRGASGQLNTQFFECGDRSFPGKTSVDRVPKEARQDDEIDDQGMRDKERESILMADQGPEQ